MRYMHNLLLPCGCGRLAFGIAALVVGLSAIHCRAFTSSPGTASSQPHSLILPFQIGKPAAARQSTSAENSSTPPTAFSPGESFHLMGWPWMNQNNGGSQLTQQQVSAYLRDVLKDMGISARRLADADAGIKTQAVQKQIISRLDALIKIAEQMQGKGGGQQQQNQERKSMSIQQSQKPNSPMTPSQSATHSYIPSGTAMTPGNLKQFQSNRHEWGNLPPRARDMILNALRHQALPQYKTLVEQYYESLAKLNQPK